MGYGEGHQSSVFARRSLHRWSEEEIRASVLSPSTSRVLASNSGLHFPIVRSFPADSEAALPT